ncbi:dTDP-4-dehydrorhamnose reductase [Pseudonocardia acaciae]|uniref:dTDP-4-dehydrorhamnose reductase n=1 Tax=Pseudonocardia acaciae TaxID=551276 RepID=UPI000685DD8A|nr:dTDP-4-dehydrorhamnose reductase [Pseudonocardia acaciae]
MIRWLVTGARGQLGSELVAALRGQDVTAAGRAELDVTSDGVADVLRAWAFADGDGDAASGGDAHGAADGAGDAAAGGGGHGASSGDRDGAAGGDGPGGGTGGTDRRLVVVNAAAWTDVDGAEADPAGAAAVNTDGPARLAACCAELGATLVQVSTDYVFDGTGTRPYEVDDPVRPATVYGETKAAGERAVRAALERHYIVRTAWLYGAVGGNFVKTIVGLRHRHDTLDVVDDQVGCPTWAAELARGVVELVGSAAPHGTYHCAGAGEASWYELARAVFAEVDADPDRIRPCDSTRFPRPARRPAYSVLSGRSWERAGLRPLPHWRESLRLAFQNSRSAFDTPL